LKAHNDGRFDNLLESLNRIKTSTHQIGATIETTDEAALRKLNSDLNIVSESYFSILNNLGVRLSPERKRSLLKGKWTDPISMLLATLSHKFDPSQDDMELDMAITMIISDICNHNEFNLIIDRLTAIRDRIDKDTDRISSSKNRPSMKPQTSASHYLINQLTYVYKRYTQRTPKRISDGSDFRGEYVDFIRIAAAIISGRKGRYNDEMRVAVSRHSKRTGP
jgi:hypothetical protein